jgi:TIR domain
VFRSPENRWLLGGQALLLLAQCGSLVYAYPRVVAPEADIADPRTLTPATDVYAIAATVCCLCARGAARNAGPPAPADVESLFPSGVLRAALSRALSPNPHSRHADATEMLAALTGRPVGRYSMTDQPCPIVISYSRKDEKEAERLTADLAVRGIRAWRDENMIPGGVQWREAIVSAIDNCRVVIFLVSRNSLESEQVPKELDIAAEAHKVILPVCLDNTKIKAQFRYLLAGVHQLEFFTRDREENLEQLIRALREHGVTPERGGW